MVPWCYAQSARFPPVQGESDSYSNISVIISQNLGELMPNPVVINDFVPWFVHTGYDLVW